MSCPTGFHTRINRDLFRLAPKTFPEYRCVPDVFLRVKRLGALLAPNLQESRTTMNCTRRGLGCDLLRPAGSAPESGSQTTEIPVKRFLKLGEITMGFGSRRIFFHSSLWTRQIGSIERTTNSGRWSNFRRHRGFRTVMPELPLRAHGMAVVQLCGSPIVAHLG